MILDARQLAPGRPADSDAPLEYDICIVGAGPAGITIALELEQTGMRICILEAGGEKYDGESQALLGGSIHGERYPPLRDTRFSGLGGSTAVWAGWCRPLDAIDFEPRESPTSVGWPFRLDQLRSAYRRAHEFCGLGEFEYDPGVWQGRRRQQILLPDDDDVTTRIFHARALRFGAAYRSRLAASNNINVVLHAPVARLHMDEGGRAACADVRTLDGRRIPVSARHYILAAGGIENARLLLLSADSPERAPGNDRGLVGRYFTEHPFVNLGWLMLENRPRTLDFYFPEPVPSPAYGEAAVRGTFGLRRKTIERENLSNAAIFPHPRYEAHAAFDSPEVRSFLEAAAKLRHKAVPGGLRPYLMRAARGPHRIAVAAARKLLVSHGPAWKWRIRGMFEAVSHHANRVTLGPDRDALNRPLPRVTWRLTDKDISDMRRVARVFDRAFRRADLGRMELRFPDENDAWRSAVEGGKHHMGTTRMHVDPARGVVDENGRVHGTTNLFVAGSSIFPSTGYANPTLTIVALAIRLANHLKLQVQSSTPRGVF